MQKKRKEILCLETDESDDDENSKDDLVLADRNEQSTVRIRTFVPDEQIAEVTVQGRQKDTTKKKKKRNK